MSILQSDANAMELFIRQIDDILNIWKLLLSGTDLTNLNTAIATHQIFITQIQAVYPTSIGTDTAQTG